MMKTLGLGLLWFAMPAILLVLFGYGFKYPGWALFWFLVATSPWWGVFLWSLYDQPRMMRQAAERHAAREAKVSAEIAAEMARLMLAPEFDHARSIVPAAKVQHRRGAGKPKARGWAESMGDNLRR
jgi:hypothetical protein